MRCCNLPDRCVSGKTCTTPKLTTNSVLQRGRVLQSSCWRWQGTSRPPVNANQGTCPEWRRKATPTHALRQCSADRRLHCRLCVRFTPVEHVVQGSVSAMKALAKDIMPKSFPPDADASQSKKVHAVEFCPLPVVRSYLRALRR